MTQRPPSSDQPRGICPFCASEHRLTAQGALVRHGFTARNVRHGETGGFHIGGHNGHPPIGTEAGNRIALRESQAHLDVALRLESRPPVSRDEASLAARQQMLAGERKRVGGPWGQNSAAVAALTLPTEDEVLTDRRWMSCRSWIQPAYLTTRMGQMERARAATVADHRAHAALLADLVAQHPSGEGG